VLRTEFEDLKICTSHILLSNIGIKPLLPFYSVNTMNGLIDKIIRKIIVSGTVGGKYEGLGLQS
jgi:hypothetical protein